MCKEKSAEDWSAERLASYLGGDLNDEVDLAVLAVTRNFVVEVAYAILGTDLPPTLATLAVRGLVHGVARASLEDGQPSSKNTPMWENFQLPSYRAKLKELRRDVERAWNLTGRKRDFRAAAAQLVCGLPKEHESIVLAYEAASALVRFNDAMCHSIDYATKHSRYPQAEVAERLLEPVKPEFDQFYLGEYPRGPLTVTEMTGIARLLVCEVSARDCGALLFPSAELLGQAAEHFHVYLKEHPDLLRAVTDALREDEVHQRLQSQRARINECVAFTLRCLDDLRSSLLSAPDDEGACP